MKNQNKKPVGKSGSEKLGKGYAAAKAFGSMDNTAMTKTSEYEKWREAISGLTEKLNGTDVEKNITSERARGKTALVLGAGVTQCIVGNWRKLLNEVTVMKYSRRHYDTGNQSTEEAPDINEYRNYLNTVIRAGECFLGDGIDVRERGEYLRYDEEDDYVEDDWREITFAGRVKNAIDRLKDEHLRDGAAADRKSIEEDFLNWKEKTPVFLNVDRREAANNEICEKKLYCHKAKDIYNELKNRYFHGMAHNAGLTAIADMKDLLRNTKDATKFSEDIMCYFPFEGDSSINEYIEQISGEIFEEGAGKSSEKLIKKLIVKITANAVWRPDYSTIDALLKVCAKGKVSKIITYNFDTCFDELLMNRKVMEEYGIKGEKRITVAVYGLHSTDPVHIPGSQEKPHDSDISIYHVHGILHDKLDIKPIIFSGTSYSEYQKKNLNLATANFTRVFYECSDIYCVGFSGSDDNFRRMIRQLMELSKSPTFKMSPRRIYITRAWKEDAERYGFREGNDRIHLAYGCLSSFISMVDNYYRREMKVGILWDEDYDQMAQRIAKIPIE